MCDSSDSLINIPVPINNRPPKSLHDDRIKYLKTVKRSNKVLNAVSLPKLACYNMRSLIPKINMLATDLRDRMCSLAMLCEVWEKTDKKKHREKIEELFELKGFQYISTPRFGNKRGGGAAILVDTEKYSISKLSVPNPKKLEIVWGLLKPKFICGRISKIIVCSFYCPPKSKKKTALLEHMTLTLQSLKTTFPTAAVLVSGDRNDLKIDGLLSIDNSLKQIVQKPTRGCKTLTVLLTDIGNLYGEPDIVPPVDVDDPEKGGVPSDHLGVVATPLSDHSKPEIRQKIIRTIRPITETSLRSLGQVITQENWQFMEPDKNPTDLTNLFEK